MSPGPASSAARGRGILVGVVSIVLASFAFGGGLPTEFRFIEIGPVGAALLVVGGALAITGGVVSRRLPWIVGGAMLVAGALVQVVGLALSIQPLGGDASAMAVVGGLGIGLLALASAPTESPAGHLPTNTTPTSTTPTRTTPTSATPTKGTP